MPVPMTSMTGRDARRLAATARDAGRPFATARDAGRPAPAARDKHGELINKGQDTKL